MKNNTKITITAIAVIGILEAIALLKGVNGALFALVLSVIAGLAGYEIKKFKDSCKI